MIEKEQIINALTKKVPDMQCPICGNKHFIIADGYSVDVMHGDLEKHYLEGVTLPSISVVCSNCGHIEKFSLGVLGLLNNSKEEISND